MDRAQSFAMQYGYYDKEKKKACCVGYNAGYKQAEKETIERIRVQIKQWMSEKDGGELTCGERLAFNSVLHLLKEMEGK